MRKILLLTLLILVKLTYAQKTISIKGKILDIETKQAIAYATIMIEGKFSITTSNAQGEFFFTYPIDSLKGNEQIIFSAMGYKKLQINLTKQIAAETTFNLTPFAFTLNEVKIYSKQNTADEIISNVIANFYKNTPNSPAESEIFYRETVKTNNNYTAFAEGVGIAHTEGFSMKYLRTPGLTRDWIVFKQARATPPLPINNVIGIRRTSHAYFVGDLNKSIVLFLSQEHYNYTLDSLVSYNNNPVYVITFLSKSEKKERLNKTSNEFFLDHLPYLTSSGKLFIAKENFALIRADFSNGEQEKYVSKWSDKFSSKTLKINATIHYAPINGKYYYSYSKIDRTYIDYGYAIDNSLPKSITESWELFYKNYDMVNLGNKMLEDKYGYKIYGNAPNRKILNDGDIDKKYFLGSPVYSPVFWEQYAMPPYTDMSKVIIDFGGKSSLEKKYQLFDNLEVERNGKYLREKYSNKKPN